MTKMYDPNDMDAMGPQVTARPGTKRHQAQCVARAKFFAIVASGHCANAKRLEAQTRAIELQLEHLLDTSAHHLVRVD